MKKYLVLAMIFSVAMAWGQDTIDIVTNQVMTGTVNHGTMVGSSWSVWHPYLNGRAISETDFYRIVGDEASAIEAQHRHTAAMWLSWGGLVSLAGGCTLLGTTDVEDYRVYTGLGLAIGGFSSLLTSLLYIGNTRPVPYAVRLADSFNASH